MSRREDLIRLDAALLDLRRFTEAPASGPRPTLEHGASRVEISTVLVVDAIAKLGGEGECSIGTIAEALHVAHSTASRLVDRAVRAGMVRRHRSAADPRRATLSLLPEGRRLQREAVSFRTGRLEEILSDWSVADVIALTQLLERFTRCAHPPAQP